MATKDRHHIYHNKLFRHKLSFLSSFFIMPLYILTPFYEVLTIIIPILQLRNLEQKVTAGIRI